MYSDILVRDAESSVPQLKLHKYIPIPKAPEFQIYIIYQTIELNDYILVDYSSTTTSALRQCSSATTRRQEYYYELEWSRGVLYILNFEVTLYYCTMNYLKTSIV